MADSGADIRADTRWLTYKEAADVLGIDPDSVARRARRLGWPRQPGNDGKARVGVPADVLAQSAPDREAHGAKGVPPDDPEDKGGHVCPDESRTIKALEGEAAALREALEREREGADLLRTERDAAEKRALQAEREREEARVRAGVAEGEAKGLRDALAEARRPLWRRWLG